MYHHHCLLRGILFPASVCGDPCLFAPRMYRVQGPQSSCYQGCIHTSTRRSPIAVSIMVVSTPVFLTLSYGTSSVSTKGRFLVLQKWGGGISTPLPYRRFVLSSPSPRAIVLLLLARNGALILPCCMFSSPFLGGQILP